jgi:predicted nicotinamide N-methyase
VDSIFTHSYQVKFETICIGDVDYTIRSLLDHQQFSDPTGESLRRGISSAMWPLFGQVWPMSKILAQVMLQESLAGKRILEIGCGLGLPSIVVKQLGGNITASDYHPLSQAFLLENTILNELTPIRFEIGDWNLENLNLGKFDLIIGSDVLYEHQHIELLSAFIHLHASQWVDIIIVDPGRRSHRAFARTMEQLGYQHTWTDLTDYPDQAIKPKGFILRFSRHVVN